MKNKKFFCITFIVLLMACFFYACKNQNSQTETKTRSNLPKLKIGVDIINPFFYIDENGDNAGIDEEIATEACKRAGYTPDFVQIDWSNRDQLLKNKKVDCLWTAFIKNGREDKYQWTDSYMKSKLRVIVDKRCPDKNMKMISDHGKVAVRSGSKAEQVLLK